jgi:MoaA/NifB/PqqE/SkfB family radical SAM enzyme
LNIPHEKFCVLPWISLETSPIGTVRPCCLAEDEIKDELGNKYKLIATDLTTVQNSDYMKNLRQEFLKAKQPQTCRKCWNEERAGRTSKRMHTLDRLKHVVEYTEWTTDAKPLMFIDFKLGNICNLKCRICGSWSSSQFAVEEIKFGGDDFHKQMLKDGAWPRETSEFWNNLDQVLDDVRYMEFTGGEPFMIKEHFVLLEKLVERGIAGQIEIHYNTNGTHYPEHAESIWQHFKTVEIAFSIDDVSERFEYQRTNAMWNEVQENIQRFRLLKHRWSNIQLQVCSTVNVYNVMYLEDLANWIDQQGFDFVYWNMLHEAYYLSVGTMPPQAKAVAVQRLMNANVSDFHKNEFAKIIDFINGGVEIDGKILRMKVEDLDWKRGVDLRTHHPELATAIGYNGPQR